MFCFLSVLFCSLQIPALAATNTFSLGNHAKSTNANSSISQTIVLDKKDTLNTTAESTAPATASDPSADTHQMMSKIFVWYRAILKIAVPCLIVSYAICGVKLLNSAMMNTGANMRDSIKRQFIDSTIALLVLCILPAILNEIIGMIKSTAWTPPAA